MTEREAKMTEKIIEQAGTISKALLKGKDVEIRKSANGVSMAEISKKVILR